MPEGLPSSQRVYQLRDRHREAGLMRVEVLVPKNQADLVKAYALQLREGSKSERMQQARQLIAKAYKKHYARCLDNIHIVPEKADFADAAVVAAALMHRGNADAYKLGQELRRRAK